MQRYEVESDLFTEDKLNKALKQAMVQNQGNRRGSQSLFPGEFQRQLHDDPASDTALIEQNVNGLRDEGSGGKSKIKKIDLDNTYMSDSSEVNS